MKNFTSVQDIGDLKVALEKAKWVKENPYADQELGKNKTLMLIFFNSSFFPYFYLNIIYQWIRLCSLNLNRLNFSVFILSRFY